MARADLVGKIEVGVNEFLTDARIIVCVCIKCVHNLFNHGRIEEAKCNLRHVDIGKNGKCRNFTLKEREANKPRKGKGEKIG